MAVTKHNCNSDITIIIYYYIQIIIIYPFFLLREKYTYDNIKHNGSIFDFLINTVYIESTS